MKIIGIIAEYNPFHLGHQYQINKIKELYPNSIIIAIISTNFTQRGEISILNKWEKTDICLNCGIDIVIELPTLYATQSADKFAYGAINILNKLNVDAIVFGSESNNPQEIINLANIQITNGTYDKQVKTYLNNGLNYPTAMSKALKDISSTEINQPNDLLALSYIKEIIRNKYNIEAISIKRTNSYHEKEIKSNIINANLIRKLLKENKDISKYVPPITMNYLNKHLNFENAYNCLIYNIINNKNNLNDYLDVDEGIENRIIKNINKTQNWTELVKCIKTKRYTYNKINRMLLHILLNIKKSDNSNETYVRVLGFNQNGQKHLNKIKKNINIITKYKPNISEILDMELKCTYIYSIITNNPSLIMKEYQNKPIIKNK